MKTALFTLALLAGGIQASAQAQQAQRDQFPCEQKDALAKSNCENRKLKIALLETNAERIITAAQADVKQIQAQRAALIAEEAKERPGYTWREGKGPNEPEGFYPDTKPEPKK